MTIYRILEDHWRKVFNEAKLENEKKEDSEEYEESKTNAILKTILEKADETLRQRNRRVPFKQRNEPSAQPKVVYAQILNINYLCYFLDILKNYNLIDDEPMWVADRVVTLTLGSAITIPETANEFAIKEEEAKFMKTFHRIRFYNDYRDRDSNRDNWHSSGRNDYNQDNYRSNFDDKLDLQKLLSDFIKAQHSTNSFVKDTFKDLKTKLKTTTKNHQASIQNLKAKFDKLVDKQSGRPSGSLPSNTQPNPKDFIIFEMEEESKVPLILGSPFLHIVDAVIRVKQKQLNLRVGTERMTFHINSAMKHSYSNDDTCFSIDVIDEILKEDFDALLDEGRLEVDNAKIDAISKLPPTTNVKGIRSFLGHILLLQEFGIKIKDKKGIENVAADHLSQIDNDETSDNSDVDDHIPGETLMEITTNDTPWFTDFANYLEDPYLFKVCSDDMIRRCVSRPETRRILDQCHHGPTGGHYGPNTTAKKVLDSSFYWPTIIKEAHTLWVVERFGGGVDWLDLVCLFEKWLTFSHGLRNANHTQTLDLVDIYDFQENSDDEDEEEVLDDEEVTQVKVLMALADDELTVGKNHAQNGKWIDITMRKVNILLSMDKDADWQNYLKYINIDLKFVEEQILNLLSKYNKLVFELNKCRELLILKQAKLDAIIFQIQNTKLTKLNHALQEQLKEEKKINEKWLTSLKKRLVERLNPNSKLPNFNTGRILVPESQAVNESLKPSETSTNPQSSNDSKAESLTPLPSLKTP
ncbi:hypothetical protein Tco_0707157 [Tanacetum coccineum]|uniref:Integrase zinc-binding domain-containing protein n=1 Tax=Tanacetum coccineum TaxID=301880 RepID=A0ABQ4YAH8_9ASTR